MCTETLLTETLLYLLDVLVVVKFFFPTKFFWFLVFFCGGGILGCLGSRGVGKRYTSSYDHDL